MEPRRLCKYVHCTNRSEILFISHRFLSLFFLAKFAENMPFKMPQFSETTHIIFKISKFLKSQRYVVFHFSNKWKEVSFFRYKNDWPDLESFLKQLT